MPSKIYYERNKGYHKQVSREYYLNNREHALEYQKNRYNNLSKEEKDERAIYARNWYNNLPEDIKQYKKSIC